MQIITCHNQQKQKQNSVTENSVSPSSQLLQQCTSNNMTNAASQTMKTIMPLPQCKLHRHSTVTLHCSRSRGRNLDDKHNHNINRSRNNCGLVTIIAMTIIQIIVLVSLLSSPCHATSRNMHQSKQSNHYYLTDYCDLRSKTLRNAKKIRTGPEKVSIKLESKDSMSSVRVLPQKASTAQRQASAPLPSLMSYGLGLPASMPASPVETNNANGSANQQTIISETINQSTITNDTNSTMSATTTTTTTTTEVPMPSPEDIQQYQAPVFKRLNCSIIVVPPPAHGLLVTVNSIGLPRNHAKLGITLNYGSPQAQSVSWDGDLKAGKYLLTQSASSMIAIHLQSFAPIDWSRVSFDILFTVYNTKANSTGCPNKSWFDCGDNICVPSSLVCDNNRNCPNGNDEMIFYRCYTPLFWSIAASTTMALLLAVAVCAIVVVRRRRAALHLAHSQSYFSNNLLHDSTGHYCAGALDGVGVDAHADPDGHLSEAGYLADNMAGGFENPVWLHQTNNTLTKRDSTAPTFTQVQLRNNNDNNSNNGQQTQQSPVPMTITSTTSTFEPRPHGNNAPRHTIQ